MKDQAHARGKSIISLISSLILYQDFLDNGSNVLIYILAQAPYLITTEEQVLLDFFKVPL